MQNGFLRDDESALVTTAAVDGAVMQGGFLRAPDGALVVTSEGGAPTVTSVNGRTGAVTLGAADVRALPDTYTPPADAAAGTSSMRRLGTGASEAAPGAAAVGRVAHGATAGTARPTGYAMVIWVGSVEPTNRAAGDLWVRTA